ncbi:MAG: histidinol-phosphate transaminase [Ruminococcus sp.]|nr:histidinol-phosphate transaminase [Ruminococcus sp.]
MSEQLWRKNLINITPYVAGEQPKSDKIIKLNANENAYPPSPKVREILDRAKPEDMRRYPSADAGPLREALAKRAGLSVDNVFVSNGSDDVLATAFRAFFNSDKPIVYPDITYSFYPVWCDLLKIPSRTVPVNEDFRIDAKSLYGEGNGGVVFANPNAPTSLAESREFVKDVLEHNKDCIVIVDQTYVDFADDGIDSLDLIKEYDNLLITHTFSKSRSMAGMRIGEAYGNAELIKYMLAVKDSYNSYPVNRLSIETGVASVQDEEYFQSTLRKVITTRENVSRQLKELGFDVPKSQTNFLFAKHPKYAAKDIFEFLREKGIYIRYFNKPRIDDRLRITIGTDDEMAQMISQIKAFMGK